MSNNTFKNLGNSLLYENIEHLSNIHCFIKTEYELLKYIEKESESQQWVNKASNDNYVFLQENNDNGAKDIIFLVNIQNFNKKSIKDYEIENIYDFQDKNYHIKVSDNTIYAENSMLGCENLINLASIFNIINRDIENSLPWDVISNEYNIKILIYTIDSDIKEIISKHIQKETLIINLASGEENRLRISQIENELFEIVTPIELSKTEFENKYELKISTIFVNNEIDSQEKEFNNAIKYGVDVINELKNNMDLDMLNINNESKKNEKRYEVTISIATNKDIKEVSDNIRAYSERNIEELKRQGIYLRTKVSKLKTNDDNCIQEQSFNNVISLTNNISNTASKLNTNINLAIINTNKNKKLINIIGLLENNTYSIETRESILERNLKNDETIINQYILPNWAYNKQDSIRKSAITTYKAVNLRESTIEIVNDSEKIDKSNVKNEFKIIEYMYHIKNDSISINNINKLWTWIGCFVEALMPQTLIEAYKKDIYTNAIHEEASEDSDEEI